jgi:hypothetical protein
MGTEREDTEPHQISGDISQQVDLERVAPEISEELDDQATQRVVSELWRLAPKMLRKNRRMRRRFERQLMRRWKRALRLYEMVMVAATEAGAVFNEKHRAAAAKESDVVFEALIQIHARASRIASEVLALLRTGHADGAHTRWRTLHELAVVAYIISEHGSDIAERYLRHRFVQNAKDAREYQSNCATLGYDPFTSEEIAEIEDAARLLVDRFGPEFKKTYGWAASLTRSGKSPSFIDLERLSGLDHLRPHYSWASHKIHADSKGIYLNLVEEGPETVLIAGLSDAGLADPGQSALISLVQITTTVLISGRPGGPQDEMDVIAAEALLLLVDAAGVAFLEAHRLFDVDQPRSGSGIRKPTIEAD